MRLINFVWFFLIACLWIWLTTQGCKNADTAKDHNDSLAIRNSIPEAPVLSPEESIKKMEIEKGLTVKLVAAEPLVTAPVAMSFDQNGRIWVVEMQGYMPDTTGTGENQPSGKVIILTDANGDGVMDQRKVFLDSLVLPRAICLIENGILVAESPKLWYYEIENDEPVKKILVDSAYAEGGNVEHQPNGLLRALDNWIYNAKSTKRYRKNGNEWLIEKTHFRGQWGISQDEYGRLFYNTNSQNLIGDYFTPGLGATNKNQKSVSGFNKKIVTDNRVYPIRPTPGVNRGYMKGILDDSLRLVNFTAACGPVIYTGNLLNKEYSGNAFVAEPSANLIKRNILTHEGYEIDGRQAYEKKEFLASEDERFRPVSLYNSPDGALYIIDMYRGIIQHKTYLTPYLKKEIKERALTQPLNCGRIYKVVPQNSLSQTTRFTYDTNSLLHLLDHPNGWVRNQAQQIIIDKKQTGVSQSLRSNLNATDKPLMLVHSLWALEGLGLLQIGDVLPLLKQKQWAIRMQALSVLPSLLNKKNVQQVTPLLQEMIDRNDTLAAPYIGFLIPFIQPFNPATANKFMTLLRDKYVNNVYAADAIISNLQNKEADYYRALLKSNPDTSLALHQRLKKVLDDIKKSKNSSKAKDLQKAYPRGAAVFQSVCATCHGSDGNGVASLAPPLNNSEWVTGNKNKLIPIVLYGLTGPIKVNDKVYKAPDINGDMPGIGQNSEISDEDIAQVLNFIRNSWNNKAQPINAKDIKDTRNRFKGRQNAFTMEELNQIK